MTTSEQLEIQALARDFADGELRPRSAGWDERRALDRDIVGELAGLGFLGMLVPEEFGGLDFDLTTYVIVIEELARGDASVAQAVTVHNGAVAGPIRDHGTAEQKGRWLPALAEGTTLGTVAFSETVGAADPALLPIDATRRDGAWRLGGEAAWVMNGALADLLLVVARTAADEAGLFLVPSGIAGFTVGEREETLGLRATAPLTVELRDVVLGADSLLGESGAGLRSVSDALPVIRLGMAALAVGIGRAAMEHAAAYAVGREQFGTAIAAFGAIQEKLAGMAERLAASRALTLEAAAAVQASRKGADDPGGLEGAAARTALAKVSASHAATWVADEAIQVYGGYGYMRHYPVEKLLRDAKGTEIYDEPSERLREVVARELLGDLGTGTA